MSRIDRQRIVGSSEEDLDELCCGICHDIFDDPVVTRCCRQTYCSVCINQWLTKNNNCPNDRQSLMRNDLTPASRVFINLVNKLNIKCANFEKCQQILTVEKMKEHMIICGVCDSCKTSKELIQEKDMENKHLNDRINDLENEVRMLRGRPVDIPLPAMPRVSSSSSSTSPKNAIDAVRMNSSYNITYEYGLTELEKTFLIDLVKVSFLNFDTFFLISKGIHEKVGNYSDFTKYHWQVIIHSSEIGGSYTASHKSLFINFNNIYVKIAGFIKKGSQKDLIDSAIRNSNHKIIYEHGLTELEKAFLIDLAKSSLRDHDTFFLISKAIHEKLVENCQFNKYKWIVVINETGYGGAYTSCPRALFIEINKLIFKIDGFLKA